MEDVLGLDHLARDEIDAPKTIRKSQLNASGAGPQQPRENIRALLETLAPPLPHDIDELLVNFVQHRLRVTLLLFIDRRKRIEEGLVLPRGERAPLHAE